jgi:choline dehydrogenase-like flavoprotein
VLPYFCRQETWEKGTDAYRGGDGPLLVSFARTTDPVFDAFIAASVASGFPYTEDYNGASPEGVGRGQFAIGNGRRQSAATAYLRPALARSNLTLKKRSHVLRLMMNGHRADGVEYRHHGRVARAYGGRETILSAGAFNSPQVLMLSGIGPADHLKEHGIVPLLDLPGVGRNLQDHLGVMVSATRPVPGPFQREMRFDRMTAGMIRAYLFGTGPATVLPGGLHAFIKTAAHLDVPDIQFIFSGVTSKPHLWFPGIVAPYQDRCGVRAILLHPESRGRVELRSASAFDKVRINQNSLSVEKDVSTLRAGVRIARKLLEQKALDRFRGEEIAPGTEIASDKQIDAWIRATTVTAHHPAGTCAMGTGKGAVIDRELRVLGTEKLRVVDASAMPDLISGNINACVVMIAEKASDCILGRKLPDTTMS